MLHASPRLRCGAALWAAAAVVLLSVGAPARHAAAQPVLYNN